MPEVMYFSYFSHHSYLWQYTITSLNSYNCPLHYLQFLFFWDGSVPSFIAIRYHLENIGVKNMDFGDKDYLEIIENIAQFPAYFKL